MAVVVVELPAKAKTINKYLGPGYTVLASYGHVRDLPAKDGSVDPEHEFAMKWEVAARQRQAHPRDRRGAEGRPKLILATDPDREGEAISWHLLEALTGRKAVKKGTEVERVVFNAITRNAVTAGDGEPAPDRHGARRRLSGAPRARLPRRLHALAGALAQAAGREVGRPGAVGGAAADRRARDGDRGVPRPRVLDGQGDPRDPAGDTYEARLATLDGKKLDKFDLATEADGRRPPSRRSSARDLDGGRGRDEAATRNPAPPFMTSTLQQEASRKFGMGARQTMRAAQRLYEAGPHHLHAHRRHRHGARGGDGRARRDPRPLRRRLRAVEPAHVQEQGEERPGSARVHPADRHGAGDRSGSAPRAGPAPALRPDLEALARQPDGGGALRAHHGRDRQRRRPGRAARHRPGRDLRRLPQGL